MNADKFVRQQLDKKDAAYGSSKELQIRWLEANGIYLTGAQKAKFREITQLDRITRIRRNLNKTGEYPYPSEVDEFNEQEFIEQRDKYSDHKPFQLNLGGV